MTHNPIQIQNGWVDTNLTLVRKKFISPPIKSERNHFSVMAKALNCGFVVIEFDWVWFGFMAYQPF